MSDAFEIGTRDAMALHSLATPEPDLVGSIRLFVRSRLAASELIDLSSDHCRYLLTVMRKRQGDQVLLFNGLDGEFVAIVENIRHRSCTLRVEKRSRPQSSEADLWLCFALLKRTPTDFLVEKATELGVSRLVPLQTMRTNTTRANCERLLSIAVEAAEQSERLTVPEICEPQNLSACLRTWDRSRRLIACFERDADQPIDANLTGPTALLVGPEGGFTDEERGILRSLPFVSPVTLGPRVLRAETAAIAGLAILQAAS